MNFDLLATGFCRNFVHTISKRSTKTDEKKKENQTFRKLLNLYNNLHANCAKIVYRLKLTFGRVNAGCPTANQVPYDVKLCTDRRTILCVYLPGFQKKVFKHVKSFVGTIKENEKRKKEKWKRPLLRNPHAFRKKHSVAS